MQDEPISRITVVVGIILIVWITAVVTWTWVDTHPVSVTHGTSSPATQCSPPRVMSARDDGAVLKSVNMCDEAGRVVHSPVYADRGTPAVDPDLR